MGKDVAGEEGGSTLKSSLCDKPLVRESPFWGLLVLISFVQKRPVGIGRGRHRKKTSSPFRTQKREP